MAQPFAALNGSLAGMDPASWLGLLPLGLPLNPAAAAGSALAGLSRPESRVISSAVSRFRRYPGTALIHLPSLTGIFDLPNQGNIPEAPHMPQQEVPPSLIIPHYWLGV